MAKHEINRKTSDVNHEVHPHKGKSISLSDLAHIMPAHSVQYYLRLTAKVEKAESRYYVEQSLILYWGISFEYDRPMPITHEGLIPIDDGFNITILQADGSVFDALLTDWVFDNTHGPVPGNRIFKSIEEWFLVAKAEAIRIDRKYGNYRGLV